MIIIFIFHIESIFAVENGVCSAYKFISMLRNEEEMMCKSIFSDEHAQCFVRKNMLRIKMRNVLYRNSFFGKTCESF